MSMSTKEQHDLLVHALALSKSAGNANADHFGDSLEVIHYLAEKHNKSRLYGLCTLAKKLLGNENWEACCETAIEILCEYVEIRTAYIVELARQK